MRAVIHFEIWYALICHRNHRFGGKTISNRFEALRSQKVSFTSAIIFAKWHCMEIHRVIGRGCLEIVYKDALEWELQQRGISF